MADVLGTVVNIAHITRRIVEFIQDAREGPADRDRIIVALFSASGVVETFRILYESSGDAPWRDKIAALVGPQGVLIQYQQLLKRILDKALPDIGSKSNLLNTLDRGWRNIKWPFDKKDVNSLLRELEGMKTTMMLTVSLVETPIELRVDKK